MIKIFSETNLKTKDLQKLFYLNILSLNSESNLSEFKHCQFFSFANK